MMWGCRQAGHRRQVGGPSGGCWGLEARKAPRTLPPSSPRPGIPTPILGPCPLASAQCPHSPGSRGTFCAQYRNRVGPRLPGGWGPWYPRVSQGEGALPHIPSYQRIKNNHESECPLAELGDFQNREDLCRAWASRGMPSPSGFRTLRLGWGTHAAGLPLAGRKLPRPRRAGATQLGPRWVPAARGRDAVAGTGPCSLALARPLPWLRDPPVPQSPVSEREQPLRHRVEGSYQT